MNRTWIPTPDQQDHARELVRTSTVIDIHTHPRAIMPGWMRRAAEKAIGLPTDPLANLPAAGVDYAVVTAVGDFLGTAWRFRQSPTAAVNAQLAAAAAESDTNDSNDAPPTRLILGVEGADFLGHDLHALERLHHRGVRVLGLVHYADNAIGTMASTLTGHSHNARTPRGLSSYGREVIAELNRLDITADLAHADAHTTIAACEATTRPVIASHSGAHAVHDFPRYIGDDEIIAIAHTGGLVGLWPASMRGRAMRDLDDFARHAIHIAELVGPAHIAIGTDKNGVPDYATGYRGSPDIINLAAALTRHGFTDEDTKAILGGNAHRALLQ